MRLKQIVDLIKEITDLICCFFPFPQRRGDIVGKEAYAGGPLFHRDFPTHATFALAGDVLTEG